MSGLSNAFGRQQYVCKVCGFSLQDYAPHCPSCLNNQIAKVKEPKAPGPSQTSPDIPSLSAMNQEQAARGLPLLSIVAGLLVLFTAYVVLCAPKPPTAQNQTPQAMPTTVSQPVESERPPAPRRHVVTAAPRSAPTRQSGAPRSAPSHGSAAVSGSAPRRGAPMQIWTSGDGD